MKAALVYTSTTPELIQMVEEEVKKVLPETAELVSFQDPSILSEVREAGYVTAAAAARLVGLYMEAVSAGADAILNLCSSVGEVADAAQDLGRYLGIPIVRVDEEMCREAVRQGKKIGVIATLPTTMEPTKHTILRVAREMNRRVEVKEALAEGGFGLDQEGFQKLLLKAAETVADQVDVILLAQGSMAYCEQWLSRQTGKTVLSSPRFGAAALSEALKQKGF